MRIAQFINTLAVADGGPARNAFELNLSLNKLSGIRADLFSITDRYEESVVQSYGEQLGPLPTPGPRWLKILNNKEERQIGIKDLCVALREVDIAVIHGYYLAWIPPLAYLLTRLGIPYVITPHGSLTSHQQGFSRRRKSAFDVYAGRWVQSHSQGFVTGSAVERQELLEKFPFACVEVGGVGTPLPPVLGEKRTWNDPLQLLSMSRIAPKKRLDVSIAAIAALSRQGIVANLIVAGEGPLELIHKLQSLARQLGVSERIHFVGQVTGVEKTATFINSDIFLLPSEDENFGIGLAEALAHGLPVVTTEAVAAAKFMTKSQGRVLVRPEADLVSEAIQDIARGERQCYCEQTRKCARDHYSWSAVAENWAEALYKMKPKST